MVHFKVLTVLQMKDLVLLWYDSASLGFWSWSPSYVASNPRRR